MGLEQQIDRDAYNLLKRNNPRLLQSITSRIKSGQTPHEIYKFMARKLEPLTASLCWCAAAYLKRESEKGLTK